MLLLILQLICFVAKMLFQWSKKIYIYENVFVGLNCNLKLKKKYMTLRTQASVWFRFLL